MRFPTAYTIHNQPNHGENYGGAFWEVLIQERDYPNGKEAREMLGKIVIGATANLEGHKKAFSECIEFIQSDVAKRCNAQGYTVDINSNTHGALVLNA